MYAPPLQRRTLQILAILLIPPLFGLYLYVHAPGHEVFTGPYDAWRSQGVDAGQKHVFITAEERRWRDRCETTHEFVEEYGRANLRMSRGYEGSHQRMRQAIQRAMRGEKITMSAIGGSVTTGHHVEKSEIWFHVFTQWFRSVFPSTEVVEVNGAAPATGSDYFSFCFPLHIPLESDIILVELAVNDEPLPEHVENMENLLRGLLALPQKPAVVLVEVIAFSTGGMGGGGGRYHLPVAQYYDVPIINQRLPLAAHFARHPQLLGPYFTIDGWGYPDTRHLNQIGHRDMAMLIGSFIHDVTCEMLAEPHFSLGSATAAPFASDSDWLDSWETKKEVVSLHSEAEEALLPLQARQWVMEGKDGEEGVLMPGRFMAPSEMGMIPRLRALEGWDPNLGHLTETFHPTCLSTRSPYPAFNLTPTYSEGWEDWVHPEHLDKPYLVAKHIGAKVSFTLDTHLGVVKMYSLRSRTFGLGTVECWSDSDRDRAVKIAGYWENGNANIGRFATIRDDLKPGTHVISCELLEETADPGGGHDFRMISIMSV